MQRFIHVFILFIVIAAVFGQPLSNFVQASGCCAGDISSNGLVDGADIAALLGSWGTDGVGDLDGSGVTDGADLAALLGAWGACPVECNSTTLEGLVQLDNGAPHFGAVVVTEFGGSAVTDRDGRYSLDVQLVADAGEVRVTAVATVEGETMIGTVIARDIVRAGVTSVPAIELSPGDACLLTNLPGLGNSTGADGAIWCAALHDDGQGAGPQIYVAGEFTVIGGVPANRIARWDGFTWRPLGAGCNNTVHQLASFHDGFCQRLVAGGAFTSAGGEEAIRLAVWDGSAWASLNIAPNGIVRAVARVPGLGSEPDDLVIGGDFTSIDGTKVNHIAKLSSDGWQTLGVGTDGPVYAIAVAIWDGATLIFAGGSFTSAGGFKSNSIAQWNGRQWNSLGSGVNGLVRTLLFDERISEPTLFVGGDFTEAGGLASVALAAWDGFSWSPLGGLPGPVWSLAVDAGSTESSPALLVAGIFPYACGAVYRWSGNSWSSVPGFIPGPVSCLLPRDRGDSIEILAMGDFGAAGLSHAKNIAVHTSSGWSSFGLGLDGEVRALATIDDAGTTKLLVGGDFASAGGTAARSLATWDGQSWMAFGTPLDGAVNCIAVVENSGTGLDGLYVGGEFEAGVVRWNGTGWSPLGSFTGGAGEYRVNTIAFYSPAVGAPELYVGGAFIGAGMLYVQNVARWNGSTWKSLAVGTGGPVTSFAVFDDESGAGECLYVGGWFNGVAGINQQGEPVVPAKSIARWNGSTWSQVGGGVIGGVQALLVHDDGLGSGPGLYVGGSFTAAGSIPVNSIARWNGEWNAVGLGFAGTVYALATQPATSSSPNILLAAGSTQAYPASGLASIAAWNGTNWLALPTHEAGKIYAVCRYFDQDGDYSNVYLGGSFRQSLSGDSFVTRLGCTGTDD